MGMINTIINADCLKGLLLIESESVDCVVSSPPYYKLRDYGDDNQIGIEETPELFIEKLVAVFAECWRVLKNDGTLWVNMGDSYASSGKNRSVAQATAKSTLKGGLTTQQSCLKQQSKITGDLKPKDLIGIPWMLALALRKAGWYLRQDIIWHKPNPMPESVTDRCTKAHEYIFMLSKSQKYYYDHEAIKTDAKESSVARLSQDIENQEGSSRVPGKTNGKMKAVGGGQANIREFRDKQRGHSRRHAGFNDRWDSMTKQEKQGLKANKRSVWTVATMPFKEAHFATFPEKLIIDCIKAGCPVGGIVLDPFMGAGTTGLVARKLGRNYIGFELNPEYIKIAEKRLADQLGAFK